ncbi:hypothetical protein [Sphingopyxis sp. MSC1_008]|jgi:hypothetical protein|uniref:hypothetical protein n=1 Tax=Sphingopyxis sp. MSC1_008 TaxID=2909265 RepID=UPI0020C00B6F|nr:hypothetical protein [Sphingopyxis sp. MSC1_008]
MKILRAALAAVTVTTALSSSLAFAQALESNDEKAATGAISVRSAQSGGENSSSKRSPNQGSNTSTSAKVTGTGSGQSLTTRHVERSCLGGRPENGQGLPSSASSCSDALGSLGGKAGHAATVAQFTAQWNDNPPFRHARRIEGRKTVDGVDGMLAPLRFRGLVLTSRRESYSVAAISDVYLENSRA